MYTVYILRTSKNTLYIGQTKNLPRRLKIHMTKKGNASKYLRKFSSFSLVYTENYATLSEALKREYFLKQLSKEKKEKLITKI
ncbi:MAG TPA: GIY-YIG nuclease family protein [Patescibacteria group bacterium]